MELLLLLSLPAVLLLVFFFSLTNNKNNPSALTDHKKISRGDFLLALALALRTTTKLSIFLSLKVYIFQRVTYLYQKWPPQPLL